MFMSCKCLGNTESDQNSEGRDEDLDLPLVDLSTIAVATNDFSMENKIGEGGFGPIYRVIKILECQITK